MQNFDPAQKIDILLKNHFTEAMSSYRNFQNDLIKNISNDLSSLEMHLNKQLSKSIRQLSEKLKKNYISSLNSKSMYFGLQMFVRNEYKQVVDKIQSLKLKVQQYLNDFCTQVLEKNVLSGNEVSLFHSSNEIRSFNIQWYSVTSRSLLEKAQIHVQGFDRPTTTWLALGLSKKKKQYGLVKSSLTKEQFIGNIYLNGSELMQQNYKITKNLVSGDVFIIENNNRMVWVYRKNRGKNKQEAFILEDNTDYFYYIAFKGPITLTFHPL